MELNNPVLIWFGDLAKMERQKNNDARRAERNPGEVDSTMKEPEGHRDRLHQEERNTIISATFLESLPDNRELRNLSERISSLVDRPVSQHAPFQNYQVWGNSNHASFWYEEDQQSTSPSSDYSIITSDSGQSNSSPDGHHAMRTGYNPLRAFVMNDYFHGVPQATGLNTT